MAGSEAARGDGSPFDLPGGPDVALLLHGLTGSPFELRPVAERLHRAGVRCVAPAMAGHGSLEDLAKTRWQDWVEAGRAALRQLPPARRLLVVGSSMGAMVACVLAAESQGRAESSGRADHHGRAEHATRIDGLALLAPAMELAWPGQLATFLTRWTPMARWMPIVPKRGGSDVADPQMRAANPCLDGIPLAAVGELAALQRHVDALLPRIRCPSLVIAGAKDQTVTVGGARHLAHRIAGPSRLVVLERSQHLVGIDVERERCASEVLSFLEHLPAHHPAHPPAEVPENPR